jgi:hypothetical protein
MARDSTYPGLAHRNATFLGHAGGTRSTAASLNSIDTHRIRIMPSVLPATDERVPKHSSSDANDRIREQMLQRLRCYERADAAQISSRIAELKGEWDIERVLEANAAGIALVGLALGATVNRRWFALPAVVAGFLLQHALQGWCPPVPAFRRLGIRTSAEIHEEIVALKAMRGDFGSKHAGADELAEQVQLH